MAQQKKKPVYLTKEIHFGNQKLVLFSLDGATWSSRKSELLEIQERHEREKVKITDIKGGEAEEEAKPAPESEASADEPFELVTDDDESSAKPKAGAKKGKVLPAAAAKQSSRKLPEHKGAKSAKAKAQEAAPKRRFSTKPKATKSKVKGKRAA